MKITKFVHACLLVEDDGQTVLFDPGQYSWDSKFFDVNALPKLDAVVITHEHTDHFWPEFVRAILAKFPDVPFTTTSPVATQLKQLGAKQVFTESNGQIQIFSKKPHASMVPLAPEPPQNIAVHLGGKLTVGGDRHDLEETKQVLALTIVAPWGSVREAAEMMLKLKPAVVIPIHDWHWHDLARQKEYERFQKFCADNGIKFIWPVDGQPVEV